MKDKGKVGVLLVNLGTPDSPDASSIRRFLKEFLSDHRVVEIPKFLWLIILNLFVLPFRPYKLIKPYQSIWTDNGSPLLEIAYQQQKQLEKLAPEYFFATAMRYGNPSIHCALKNLQAKNIEKLLILPLYPQYSGSTTAAVFDKVTNELQQWRNIPEFRMIKDYYDLPAYIDALANTVISHRKLSKQVKPHLMMSFHGIPIDYCKKGDPYDQQCEKTAKLLAKHLELNENEWTLSYQSLFGKAEWLKPYTSVTLSAMPKQEIKNIDVICPGFSNDCLETLEEIKIENRKLFLDAGGESYEYISALNASDNHIKMLHTLIETHTKGWMS